MNRNMLQHLHLHNIYNCGPRIKKQRNHSKRIDHFALSDAQFKKRYPLAKSCVRYVIFLTTAKIQSTTKRNRALSASEMVLLTLRFYSSGSFLLTVGDYCGVSVATASVVQKVSYAIACLSSKFICMPNSEEEIKKTAADFFLNAKFPKVIGAIDGTHVRIQSPGGINGEAYRNRKGYFSINVQAICNSNLIFTDIVARWPGSAHDSYIFNNSRIHARIDSGEFGNYYILEDSGYGVKSYMMTPLRNPQTNAENLYNESQIRTRNVIERCFGVWKRRFPILSMGIRVSLNTTMTIIVACAVLHNLCRYENDDWNDDEDFSAETDDEDSQTKFHFQTLEATLLQIILQTYNKQC